MLRTATTPNPVTVQLAPGALLTWTQGPVLLRVVSGIAWVTRPNDLGDYFLHAGQALHISEGLIGAETELRLSAERDPQGRGAGQRRVPGSLSRWFHAAGAAFSVPRHGALRKEPTS
jgi:hypothetical protein